METEREKEKRISRFWKRMRRKEKIKRAIIRLVKKLEAV